MIPVIRRLLLLGLAVAVMAGAAALPARAASPRETVETVHAALIDAMKAAETEDVLTRFERLAPVLDKTFDLRLMAALSAGTYWRSAEKPERDAMAAAFRRMSIATYAAQFADWSGESFETLGERDGLNRGPNRTRLVDTRLVRPDGEAIGFVYVLKEQNGAWRIVDILLDNDISQLAVHRSEYAQVLSEEGLPGLTGMLEAKTDQLLTP